MTPAPPFPKLKCWWSFSSSRGHPIVSSCLSVYLRNEAAYRDLGFIIISPDLWSCSWSWILGPSLGPLVCRDNNDDCDDEDSAETRGWRLWTLSIGFNHSLITCLLTVKKENGTREIWESNRYGMLNSFVNDYLKFWLIINYSIDSVNMKSLPLAR